MFGYRSPPMTNSRRPCPRPHARIALIAWALALAPGALDAQEIPPVAPLPEPSSAPTGVSPGGAFLRAVLVPGWGHASIGSYGRGGFYFLAEGITAYGLIKTRLRLGEARDRVDFREEVLRERAARDGLSEEELEALLDEDATLDDLGGLVNAREQQQEDWLAFGIFLLFLSGADAYVSAHLKDFPAPLQIDAVPAGGGRMDVSVGIRLPR